MVPSKHGESVVCVWKRVSVCVYLCVCVCMLEQERESVFVCICVANMVTMGWPRVVGSLKTQVSFAKETYKRDDILQKRPIILRSLLTVATQ